MNENQLLTRSFQDIRNDVIGIDAEFDGPYGRKKLVYADWIASGRLYRPIEDKLINEIGPMVGNTHSESSITGQYMTHAYHDALQKIKTHVNAAETDVIISTGTGMTGALAKLQRMLGLMVPEQLKKYTVIPEEDRPVVFITHMEHHSNHTSWLESIADVVVVPPGENLLVDPALLEKEVQKFDDRKVKIGSFTACSNVTGIRTPYQELAKIMHSHGGWCFVDFAASAPYDKIDMHPEHKGSHLDAIYFSPHKFLGGPGSAGVLIFNKELYHNNIPDQPGGGTVKWTNPWGGRSYFDNIEMREDGGTPGFMQTIRTALCVDLKEQMGVDEIHSTENLLLENAFDAMSQVKGLQILAGDVRDRLGVISFYFDHLHYNLVVQLLSDRFGIQVRGGCSCAGTYGHYLLNVDEAFSCSITEQIDKGDLTDKPGWVRLSIHPTTTREELDFIVDAIAQTGAYGKKWGEDYGFDKVLGAFTHKKFRSFHKIGI
ncbi:MAG: aminotransferase class V-fold PLP-dependent enzyme [Cyclobacteriaceae bacterium]